MRAGGVTLAPWYGGEPSALRFERDETEVIRGQLFERLLDGRIAFLAGVEQWIVHERGDVRELRRTNAAALWQRGPSGDVERRIGLKSHLVIGGETAFGLEDVGFVRDLAYEMAGYVPDIVPGERAEVLALRAAGGDYHLAATVCFDNAFEDVYVETAQREPVDAHVVLSNEAWYKRSFELDQMVAFSKVAAIETGRAVVRCTIRASPA
ncbi:MAG: hypothetical protein R3F34_08165 [Planctomycetota bacterium]